MPKAVITIGDKPEGGIDVQVKFIPSEISLFGPKTVAQAQALQVMAFLQTLNETPPANGVHTGVNEHGRT